MTQAPSRTEKSTIDRTAAPKPIRYALGVLSRTSPTAATRLAARFFTSVPQKAAHHRERQWAQGGRRLWIPWKRGYLAAWSWGQGDSRVLLMHGWGGRGMQLGAFAAPLVAAGYQVVALDGPGHGASPGRRSNLVDLAGGITAAAQHLGPMAGMVCHSLGATATIYALGQEYFQIPSVVAIAPPTDMYGVTDRFGEATGLTPDVVDRMRSHFESRLAFKWQDLESERLGARLSSSLLVVHDRHDGVIPWQDGSSLAHAAPRGRFLLTEHLGHRRILRDPHVVAIATRHLASNAPRSFTEKALKPTQIPKPSATNMEIGP